MLQLTLLLVASQLDRQLFFFCSSRTVENGGELPGRLEPRDFLSVLHAGLPES
jgi:hypothetical protein